MTRLIAAVLGAVLLAGSAQAADIMRKAPPVSAQLMAPAPFMQVFGGFAAAPHSWFADVGAVWAFNRNLNSDGWLLRVRGGGGEYDYKRQAGANIIKESTPYVVGELMVGYQWYNMSGARLSLYGGVNVEDHDSDDPTAKIRGTEWGAKGQAELYVPLGPNWYAFLLGNISSAWTSYFTLAKVGYTVTPWLSIGPEVAALGNDRFDAQRLGGFAGLRLTPQADLILSLGYQWQDSNNNRLTDNDGVYGTVHIRAAF